MRDALVDVPELVRRIAQRTGLGPSPLARVLGVPRETISRITNSDRRVNGRNMSHAVAIYEYANRIKVQIPRVQRKA